MKNRRNAGLTPIALISILLFNTCNAQRLWRGIEPLKTTRMEVEALIGPSKGPNTPEIAMYETKDARATIRYSGGGCGTPQSSGWNVISSTVTEVNVYPLSKVSFADLKLRIRDFTKNHDPEIMFVDEYTSFDKGVSIRIDTSEDRVESIRYFPATRSEHLLCKQTGVK